MFFPLLFEKVLLIVFMEDDEYIDGEDVRGDVTEE